MACYCYFELTSGAMQPPRQERLLPVTALTLLFNKLLDKWLPLDRHMMHSDQRNPK